ncbi:GNAT family N-acetyltransferase [Sulfitobacter sp. S0837]|uniref:GNAT family N-acetyltransferase n=1 Tax=Sulfitobacter maritimus TaxID=2741719 RepID=UPI0015836016|nr:GNAT family N-acetyltransferase [Sulfitobacter maritimus]NUH65304.1 GNAT family N-acetyltransferase [Sulfitobacter maritimus]
MSNAQPFYDAGEATWPAARRFDLGPWTLRDGQGGGKRVSAATARASVTEDDIPQAETAMREMGQRPLFMLREGDDAVDALLAARGYETLDPTTILNMPLRNLTDVPIPPVTAFCIWEPLAIMTEVWAAGGIGPARLAVMDRAATKTGLLARWNEKPAGVAFAGVHGDICMVHAVEVLPHQQRQGVATWIMRAAAHWGQAQGASQLSVLCVEANARAQALYAKLGFAPVGRYHYRQSTE